ncbi:MAG: hypothetical protein FWG56_03355 [Desulfovibrionaceae bacterium]|nr:hypothetical protein [Desulfovibrionaceae bacterium]
MQPISTHSPLIKRAQLADALAGLLKIRGDLRTVFPAKLDQACLAALEQAGLPPEVRSHWVRYLAKPFAQELGRLYDSVADMLQAQGVEKARYRLKLTESGLLPASPA